MPRTMRFILAEEFWVLDALSPAEWQLIRELPDVAAGNRFSDKAKIKIPVSVAKQLGIAKSLS